MSRVLSIQDLSCLGQCSLGAAVPVLSACGCECAVLPVALLSTHTGAEFTPPYIASLEEHLPAVLGHWGEMGVTFDAIQVGYLGNERRIALAMEAIDRLRRADTLVLVDPAMGDGGRFYRGFGPEYARAMVPLCRRADILVPNFTEACLLLGEPVPETCTAGDCLDRAKRLAAWGPETVVLTGLELHPQQMTNLMYRRDGRFGEVHHVKLPGRYHGTGDLFAAALLGRMLAGDELTEALRRAVRFVSAAIARTPREKGYGTNFESCLKYLVSE